MAQYRYKPKKRLSLGTLLVIIFSIAVVTLMLLILIGRDVIGFR